MTEQAPPIVSPNPTIEVTVAVLQRDMVHLTSTVNDLKIGQEKMQVSIEKMTEKLDTAYITKDEFFRFQQEIFNPVKKRVDSLWWNLALFTGAYTAVGVIINWYLLYHHN